MTSLADEFRRADGWAAPRTGLAGPLRLACTLEPPASAVEIDPSFPGQRLPPLVRELWLTLRGARLFVDVDYGQWGLELLPPAAAAEATARERVGRPGQLSSRDVVVGRFLGDLELLLVAADGSVLVDLPLDPREDWDAAAPDLTSFVRRFFDEEGRKYWDSTGSGP